MRKTKRKRCDQIRIGFQKLQQIDKENALGVSQWRHLNWALARKCKHTTATDANLISARLIPSRFQFSASKIAYNSNCMLSFCMQFPFPVSAEAVIVCSRLHSIGFSRKNKCNAACSFFADHISFVIFAIVPTCTYSPIWKTSNMTRSCAHWRSVLWGLTCSALIKKCIKIIDTTSSFLLHLIKPTHYSLFCNQTSNIAHLWYVEGICIVQVAVRHNSESLHGKSLETLCDERTWQLTRYGTTWQMIRWK